MFLSIPHKKVQDKLISDIDVPIRIFNDEEYLKARELLFTEQEKAMTGATASSSVVLKACEQALLKASGSAPAR